MGGGNIGERKVEGLLAAGARVTLVSPEATTQLSAWSAAGRIRWSRRRFEPGDLADQFLVVAATSDTSTNQAVFTEAEALGRLCNVVDVPELCNFILPAIARSGEVTVAVSTSGASPTLAQRLRDRIAALVGPEYGELARLLRALRPAVHARFRDDADRKRAWARALDSEAITMLQQGRTEEAQRVLERAVEAEACSPSSPA